MGVFIVRQPNGLYCRFSTIVACPTHWNMSKEDYIELCAELAREEAKQTFERHLCPFEFVKDMFYPGNMTESEFETCLREMGEFKETYE